MSLHQVYLLLGSNLNNRKKQLENAIFLINNEIGEVVKQSEIMETEPVGFESDHPFLNQVVCVDTELSPIELLNKTQNIEQKLGRLKKTRADKYQDREIDIDILLYENLRYKGKRVEIPHKKNMYSRRFVKELFNKLL